MILKFDPRQLTLAFLVAAGLASSGCAAWWGEPPKPPADLATPGGGGLSIDTPITQIIATPAGKRVIDQDLPGLLARPEFPLFKNMTPKALAAASSGKISTATLEKLQQDLQNIRSGGGR